MRGRRGRALRESLIALAAARFAGEGQQTKMEMIYRYLTGPRFRHRIEAVVERFSEMQADLDRDAAMTRLWAKREEQIRGVVETTAGLYGDLQGIAGRSLQEIEGLEVPVLDGLGRVRPPNEAKGKNQPKQGWVPKRPAAAGQAGPVLLTDEGRRLRPTDGYSRRKWLAP